MTLRLFFSMAVRKSLLRPNIMVFLLDTAKQEHWQAGGMA